LNISTEKRVIEAVERFEAMEKDVRALIAHPAFVVSPVDPGFDGKELMAEWASEMEKLKLIMASLEADREGYYRTIHTVGVTDEKPEENVEEKAKPDTAAPEPEAAAEKVPAKKARKSKAKR